MNLQKHKPYRNRKMLDAARDMPCIRCGKEGETRACHYNGTWQLAYGKGRGQKCSDLMTAEFCGKCDSLFTEGFIEPWLVNYEDNLNAANEARNADFHHWIAMTNIRRIENGWLG